MKLLLSILALAAIAAVSVGQGTQDHLKKAPKPQTPVSSGPVTQAEAQAMFLRMERAFRQVNKISDAGPSCAIPKSNSPVTREQTVIEMSRLFDMVRPKFTLKPPMQDFDPSTFTLHDKTAKAAANKLVAWGCIGRFAPLVTGSGTTIPLPIFGDAMGLFIARMAELTHTPSSKFSPYLKVG